MRDRILALVTALRATGIEVSPAETMDAVAAVAAAGVERETMREALAAAVVKDEADRPAFDHLFDRIFPSGAADNAGGRRRRRAAGGGARAGEQGRGSGSTGGRGREAREERLPAGPTGRRAAARSAEEPGAAGGRAGRAARVRRLLSLPLREFTAVDVTEARELVRELGARLRGRFARRQRQAKRGRLDVRRTLRAATASGGVPLRRRFRARRPGRPDLVALCDLSGSVAAASELLLGLIAPAARYFRRVHLFAYVDRLCPVSIENGHVAPGGPLDLHARSDFGRVLEDLSRQPAGLLGSGTLLLILGDARNNRRPPRPDLLRDLGARVQRVVWLVPEPRARWDTGDSVLRLYAPACSAVLECLTLEALVRAVRRVM
jgi:uncharacterized protein with von Willebrand factor type A (vWA) domain